MFPINVNARDISYVNVTYHWDRLLNRKLVSCQHVPLNWDSGIFRIDIKSSAPIVVFYVENDGVNNQLVSVTRWEQSVQPVTFISDTWYVIGVYQQTLYRDRCRNIIVHSANSKNRTLFSCWSFFLLESVFVEQRFILWYKYKLHFDFGNNI